MSTSKQYSARSVLNSYLKKYSKWSYRGFLNVCRDKIVNLSLSNDWHDLDDSWASQFLEEAGKLDEKNKKSWKEKVKLERDGKGLQTYWEGVIKECGKGLKKRKLEDKENIEPKRKKKSVEKCKPYPCIRSWTTNGVIRPDQKTMYYYVDPAETNMDLIKRILSVIIVGTFGILELNSNNDYDSPFNIRDPLQNPNLSKKQVQKLFKEFEFEHKLKVEPKVIEDIYMQTNGHAGMVCLCGSVIEKMKILDDYGNFNFASWKGLVFTSLNRNIYDYGTFNKIIKDLLKEEAKPIVDLLRLKFLSNSDPVTITSSQDLIYSYNLVRYGILNPIDNHSNIFMISSPLLRSVILRYVLPNIFKYCPSTDIPKRLDQSIDMIKALKDAVHIFDKENIRLAALHSYKTAHVPIGGCFNVLVPRESVYQQQLAGIFINWISSIGFEIMSQYHITKGKKHCYSDLVITAPSSLPGKPTAILELLATSTKKELDEHFKRTLKYAQLLRKSLFIRDIWVIHFTCEDEPDYHWPTKKQREKGLNAIMFWHNHDFTSAYMSACYNNENGNMIEIIKEYIV
ncbi:hypothetical protein C1645_744762 [Glomus cerebriforme]|uniref:Uncharacterized protein n=1 Tax=Glomus cerebriforme TaxID=658196 RepID=A0A397S8N5_9GLOM|nr:hypothetical protein C1645_744762 [Glomus cerebriforme]